MSTEIGNKDPVHVAAGLKGVLARGDVSDEAKARAEDRLGKMGYSTDTIDAARNKASASEDRSYGSEDPEADEHQKHVNHVNGGYKATLKNPNVSEEAKDNAREHLGEADDSDYA
uniref:Conidiation-specific protein 6 n=1 Tax=Mycena chlorophos TaxID=658473 RepID=A0ABQ0LTS7_MYCCL|nr:predicted protein [Mycena chlorophos]